MPSMVTTSRPGSAAAGVTHERAARPSSTEVDDGGEILLLLERGGGDPLATHRRRNTAIQESGGHLDGVARHDAGVDTVEPARSPLVPGAILDDHVVVDAVALGLTERRVGDLVHSDRAPGRPGHLQQIPR